MKTLFTSILIGLTSLSFGQVFNWVTTHEQTSGSDYATDITVDMNGNVWTVGIFRDTVDFDYTTGVAELISAGEDDIFIQKHDSDGNLIWAKGIGGPNFDRPTSIHAAQDGSMYISGYYTGTVDFDPGVGVANNTSSGQDAFYIKLDANGDYVWSKFITGTSGEIIETITTDAFGNIVLAGHFAGMVDFDPGAGTSFLTTNGVGDCFVVRLDPNANFIWAKNFGGSSLDWIQGMDTDSDGNILTAGRYQSPNMDFDPGAGTSFSATAGTSDTFVHSLDSSGNFNWVSTCNGPGFQEPEKLYVDALDNVYCTGFAEDSMIFDSANNTVYQVANGTDVFLWKLDQTGTHQWSHVLGGSSIDQAWGLAEAPNGDIYMCGFYNGAVDFDPTAAIDSLDSEGSLYIVGYDANGDLTFKYQNQRTAYCTAKALCTDGDDIYIAGEYLATVDFNYDVAEDTLTKTGSIDVYILNLGPAVGSSIAENSNFFNPVLYPNPISGEEQLTVGEGSNLYDVELYGLNGQLLLRETMTNAINLGNIDAGVYLIKISSSQGSVVKKIIIQ